jgi:hypothetical protein
MDSGELDLRTPGVRCAGPTSERDRYCFVISVQDATRPFGARFM